MSVILANGDRLEVRFFCQQGEQGSVNTVFYRCGLPSGGDVTDLNAATLFDSEIGATMKIFLTSTTNYQGCTVRVANQLPLPVEAIVNTNAGAGTGGAVSLPRQTSGLIDFRTEVAGPGGRGRWFMPFPATGANELNGKPTAAYVASLSDFALALRGITEITGGGAAVIPVEFVLWSRKFATMRTITGSFGSTRWATQRKRGSFGRPNSGPF